MVGQMDSKPCLRCAIWRTNPYVLGEYHRIVALEHREIQLAAGRMQLAENPFSFDFLCRDGKH